MRTIKKYLIYRVLLLQLIKHIVCMPNVKICNLANDHRSDLSDIIFHKLVTLCKQMVRNGSMRCYVCKIIIEMLLL